MSIATIMNQREIRHLCHFTRAENLRAILTDGLTPRMFLDGKLAIFNDEFRYDRCENAVCTTIEFPNYKMFYQLRCANPGAEWAVLLLDAQILIDYECAFCQTNAGSATSYTIPLEDRIGAEALASLYAPIVEGVWRSPFIPMSFPTSPQAEVLVFDVITANYIEAVYFENAAALLKFNDLRRSFNMSVDTDWFGPRADYKLW